MDKFCETTSLHGWSRLQNGGSWIVKIYWITVILGSLALAVVFIHHSLYEFSKSTVDTKVTTTTAPLWKTIFPKMTICNAYKMRQSFVEAAFGGNNTFRETHKVKMTFQREFLKGYDEEMKGKLNISHLYLSLIHI